jgi:sulfur relay (sulfurtransferase) DsrF/TusC family protein
LLWIRQRNCRLVLVTGQFNLKILIIVNESPWSSSLGVTALRMVRAVSADKAQIAAVYFREEGVYHAQRGRAVDN